MKEKKKKSKVYVYGNSPLYRLEEYKKFMKKKGFKLKQGTFKTFKRFITDIEEVQIDTETNMTDFVTDRVLYVLQFGNVESTEQHIFDISALDRGTSLYNSVSEFLDSKVLFYAQNGKFEYKIIFSHFGVKLKRFRDTFLAAKVLHSGIAMPGENSLAGLVGTYLGLTVSKEEQTTFTGEPMTVEQLYYATMDVVYLKRLYIRLMRGIARHDLGKIMKIENNVMLALADMEIAGVRIDTKALDENIKLYDENAEKHRQAIIDVFMSSDDDIMEKIREGNFLQREDEIIINWKSSVQKKRVLMELYPGETITSSAKASLVKLKKTIDNPIFIDWMLEGDNESVENHLISRHMDFLIEEGMYIKKGTINLNFNSPAQLLKFFRIWHPSLAGVGVKALKRLKHPIFMSYKKYSKAQKLVSSFGEKMYSYIEEDGKIHTDFNQIVPSGSRLSSRKPK